METSLNDLALKRASLSARDVNARAKGPVGCDGSESAARLFERWEESVMTHESAAGVVRLGGHVASDVIEREFVEEEQRAKLQAKLAELKANKDNEGEQS